MTEKKLKQFAQRALSTFPTVQASYSLAERALLDGVEGDLVECGVFAGTQSAAMALAVLNHGKGNKIHLFDSFEGIPESGPNDDETITALIGEGQDKLVTTGISACSVEKVKNNMKQWGIPDSMLVYHKGWFQDTVPKFEASPISILRLDGDLYSSTKVCMDYLAERVPSGGFIIIDDYALTGCRKAVHEYLDSRNIDADIIKIEGGLGPAYWRVK